VLHGGHSSRLAGIFLLQFSLMMLKLAGRTRLILFKIMDTSHRRRTKRSAVWARELLGVTGGPPFKNTRITIRWFGGESVNFGRLRWLKSWIFSHVQ
jgi:hypothetical protein